MFRAFCIGMDTPRSLKAHMLLKHGEYEQLARMKIHPSEYTSADAFAVDYGVVSFLKKNADLPSSIDRRQAAITAFASSEERCKETNGRLTAWMNGDLKIDASVVEVIHLAQRKISRLLSKPPNLLDGPYSWGPGATYELTRTCAYPDTKAVELPFFVTGSAWKHAARVMDADLHWKDAIAKANSTYKGPIFAIVPGGRYDTVPKTVLTDRSILVEPRLNTILQKRVGLQLKGLLKRVDVDLEDQSRNQVLAAMARHMDLATLDLEAASDSVSRKVVEILLPPCWFDILDDLRSKWYQGVDGTWLRLEKFSSMGNGFTFELESLIFWALASASSELSYRSTVGVYGDDIIVHRDAVPLLVESLSTLGFVLNKEKSFVDGEFFESCGKHYFGGHDVTPLYQKCTPRDGAEAARLGNRLLRYAARLGLHVTLDKRVRGAWEEWRRSWDCPREQLGPYLGEGDGYWEVPISLLPSDRTRYRSHGVECKVECYSIVKREIPSYDEAMYAIWLMQSVSHDMDIAESWWGPLSSDRIDKLYPQSTVSVKGSARKPVISSSASAEIGYISSRVKPRIRRTHRWVQLGPLSTALDW